MVSLNSKFKIVTAIIIIIIVILISCCVVLFVKDKNKLEVILRPHPSVLHQTADPDYIQINASAKESLKLFINDLNDFLHPYKTFKIFDNRVDCNYNTPPQGSVCKVDVGTFRHCRREHGYGYSSGKPCIFLKLQSQRNWIPEAINHHRDLSIELPNTLKDLLQQKKDSGGIWKYLQAAWISCDGETDDDKLYLGPIKYYPDQVIPGFFFMTQNNEGYVPPLIAIHLQHIAEGIDIRVRCDIWAKNINRVDPRNRISKHFIVRVDI